MEPLKTDPKPKEKEIKSFGFIHSDSKLNQKVSAGAIIPIVLAVVVKSLVAPVLKEQAQSIKKNKVTTKLEQFPAFVQIYRHEPEIYEEIKVAAKQVMRQEKDMSKALSQVNPLMMSVLQKYLPVASDEAVTEFGTARLSYYQDQKVCEASMSGDTTSVSKNFSQKQIMEFNQVIAKVVETGASQPKPLTDLTQSRQFLSGIFQEMVLIYGDDMALLSPGPAQSKVPEQTCKVMADFYQRILQLPSAEVAPALRYMITSF